MKHKNPIIWALTKSLVPHGARNFFRFSIMEEGASGKTKKENADDYANKGVDYLYKENTIENNKAAIGFFDKALEIAPLPRAFLGRGSARCRIYSIMYSDKMAFFKPGESESIILMAMQDFDRAEKGVTPLLASPNTGEVNTALATFALIWEHKALVEIDPDITATHLERAFKYREDAIMNVIDDKSSPAELHDMHANVSHLERIIKEFKDEANRGSEYAQKNVQRLEARYSELVDIVLAYKSTLEN
jgi:tetratricopeptide (TPR) repeat protein